MKANGLLTATAIGVQADLEDHIEQCEQQFQKLIARIDRLDSKLDHLEQLILDLKISLVKR